jgi:hypothetical protein
MMPEMGAWENNNELLDKLIFKGFLRGIDKKSWMGATIFSDFWVETDSIKGFAGFPKPATEKQYTHAQTLPSRKQHCKNYILWRKCVDDCLDDTLPNVRPHLTHMHLD